ncbi:MAG: hypothetical protein KAH93_01965 [Candidatus Aenigmarchaeota archaeon]|nr:hypothetical protein [Candidatus Aenigmarchaeota archaeon]
MKEKERRGTSIRDSDSHILPNLPFSSKKNESEGQRHSSVMLEKDETLAKTKGGSSSSMKEKIAHLFGGKETSSKPGKTEFKAPQSNETSSMQTQEIDPNDFKVQKPSLKANVAAMRNPIKSHSEHMQISDIKSVSVRLSELEEHVMEMHSAFDEFVLQADQYMNYEQFIEIRKEIEDKIKMLDKIEKSLDDSREQIVKDSGYMDSILGGFKYTKKRIDLLEKRLDIMSKSDNSGNGASTLRKLVSPFGGHDVKHENGSLESSGLEKTISELKNQVDNLKQRDADILKELETLKAGNCQSGKIEDSEMSETIKSLHKEIDGLKERITSHSDPGELESMKRQISEFGARLENLDKGGFEGVNGGDALMDGYVVADANERIEALEKKMKSVFKNKDADGASEEFESMRKNMVSRKALQGVKTKVDEINKRIDENALNSEKVNALRRQMDELLAMRGKNRSDKSKLKKEIEDEIVKELDVDAKVKRAMGNVKKKMTAEVDAMQDAQSGGVGREEFIKRQDELKREIAILKKDIKGMSGVQDSLKEIRDVVNNLRKEIRKEGDERVVQSVGGGVREDDIAEIRSNIEKLKAISQDL